MSSDSKELILNSALYHAKPHLGRNSMYLHYWTFHATDNIRQAQSLANLSEVKILSNAKAKITRARNLQLQYLKEANLDIDLDELAVIEQLLLDGSWLQNFSMWENAPGAVQIPSAETVLQIGPDKLVKDAQDVFSANVAGLSAIEDDILNQVGGTQQDIDNYIGMVQEYFTSGVRKINAAGGIYRTRARGESSVTSWQAKALESLLSRNNEAFFQKGGGEYKGIYQKWEGEKTKLITAIEILQDPQSLKYIKEIADSGKVEIRHEDGTIENCVKTVQEVLTALFEKIRKYQQQLNAIAAEAAVGQGIGTLFKKFEKQMDSLGLFTSESTTIGGRQISVQASKRFEGNKKFFDLVNVEGNKSAWENANTRTSKSDAFLEIGDDLVRVRQGITVKDYRSVKISGPGASRSATIDIQSGTPLLTLLTREANLSSAEMHSIFQLLSGHTDESDTGVGTILLSYTWNNIIDKAKYLALLDTMAGFTNNLDQAMYFVFNGKIYSMWDIMGYFQDVNDYKDAVKWTAINGTIDYSDYHALDEWIGKKWRAKSKFAEDRSDITNASIAQQMYDTKMEVKIHIADLAAFTNLSLN